MSTYTTTPDRRTWLRILLVLLGGAAFALGVLSVAAPAATGTGTLGQLVGLLGNDFVLVAVLALLAILIVVAVLAGRGVGGLDQATPPDPEDVYRVPKAGEPFDDLVSAGGPLAWVEPDRHDEVRTRLRKAAVTAVMREANCTQVEAREHVEAGTWTENAEAAAFLTESGTPGLAARLTASLRGESPFQRAARTTAAEIAAYDREVT